MIIEYCENEYSVKWKHDESDEWKTANLDDLIRAYEAIYEPSKHSMSCKTDYVDRNALLNHMKKVFPPTCGSIRISNFEDLVRHFPSI